ncbi:hypothetical protein KALB_5178 [Kutzneria albida DSM 43870]|uniref:OmpR/PhoB-type domain-containing protein n=1 Tax=Kutzneria albida DSM 43870 TaxID=1449976 RepID=W5WCQ5_9PSEU|nr:hypothetical protein KALB_5178 [Kutzneria albida DSM 43870]
MGRHTWSVVVAGFRFVGRVMRGLLAVIVLLALVAGLPWALVHLVGWPLPDHVPTWDEVQAMLLNPMSPQLLLNILAVLCWIVWALFVFDVARCTVDAACGITWPQVSPSGPLRGLATTLIGTIVLTLLGNRAPYTTPTTTMAALTSDLAPVVVTAPMTPGPAAHAPAADGAVVQQTTVVIDRAAPAPPGMVQVTEEVRLPHDGIYDSLSRVAERIYGPGGGSRWPELFQLNRGVPQPDGRTLSDPNLVRPGWRIIAYIPAPPDEHPPQIPPQPPPTTSTASTTPPTTPPTAPASTDHAGQHRSDRTPPGLDLATGAFVSGGLAAVVAAAMLTIRMQRRRRYRAGSGHRADLNQPIAPVVRALRIAHDHTPPTTTPAHSHPATPLSEASDSSPAPDDVREGHDLALDLAATHGLGLIGPGVPAVIRALLVHVLAQGHRGRRVQVLISQSDLDAILDHVDRLPGALTVLPSLRDALTEVETTLLTRARERLTDIEEDQRGGEPELVLIATLQDDTASRLLAILRTSSPVDVVCVLAGRWPHGTTAYVALDGLVTETTPSNCLTTGRLFTLPDADTDALLTLLHDAEEPADRHNQPAPPPSPAPRSATCTATLDRGVTRLTPADSPKTPMDDAATTRPLWLQVFGPIQLAMDHKRLGITPKARELLAYLALHPRGVRREKLVDDLWPDANPDRPYNNLHYTLSRLRADLGKTTDNQITDLVRHADGRYQLDPVIVHSDYQQLQNILAAPAAATQDRLRAARLYQGALAEDLARLWLDGPREAVHRDVLDLLSHLTDTETSIDAATLLPLLETARQIDPTNESVYRIIMRNHARLRQYDAIERTLALLTTNLAEIDRPPSKATLDLAAVLRHRDATVR